MSGGFNYIGSQVIEQGTYRMPVVVFTQLIPLIHESPMGMLVVNMDKALFEKEITGLEIYQLLRPVISGKA